MKTEVRPLADDLLTGAGPIAEFVFGSASRPNQRRVYHHAECGRLPVFRIGRTLAARKSELRAALSAGKAA